LHRVFIGLAGVASLALAASCSHDATADPELSVRVEPAPDPSLVAVAHPEQFALVQAALRQVPNELRVNGVVAPDVSRTVHVTPLAGGKLVDIRARLGDEVEKGQVLLVVHTPELTSAIADYRKALADQRLSEKALRRAKLLFDNRALALKDLQQAENDAEKNTVDVQTAAERIRILGGDVDHLSPLIEVRAPIAGTVIEQNAAGGEAVKSLDNSPNLLTVADLSRVWVLCDVYEADLGVVRVGDTAEVRLNAYPDRTLSGRVSDISRILDQTTRTAKVRIELDNAAGLLRPGAGETAAAQVSSVAAWRTIRRLCRSTGIPPFPTFDRADAKAVHGSAPTGTRAPWQRENAGQGEQRCTRVS